MKLIFTSDWHLRKDTPICRKDDFQIIQTQTLNFISKIAKKYNAKIIIAGDIYNKARLMYSQDLEILLYNIFKGIEIFFDAGNHDLQAHDIESVDRSNIGVLRNFNNWNFCSDFKENKEKIYFKFFNYGDEIKNINENEYFKICVLHKYCEEEKLPDYIDNGITAKGLLEKYNYDLFIVGDNHRSFVYEKDGRIVFNCGCIIRQSVTEKDYKPAIYIFDTETKKYETIFLPDNDSDVIDISHIENLNKRNKRIDKFISKMKDKDFEIELDFEKNLENYIKNNSVDKFVKEKINMSLED